MTIFFNVAVWGFLCILAIWLFICAWWDVKITTSITGLKYKIDKKKRYKQRVNELRDKLYSKTNCGNCKHLKTRYDYDYTIRCDCRCEVLDKTFSLSEKNPNAFFRHDNPPPKECEWKKVKYQKRDKTTSKKFSFYKSNINIPHKDIARNLELYEDTQLIVAMEELSELIQALSKHLRGKTDMDNIIEETADVYIMLETIKVYFEIDNEEINKIIHEKLERIGEAKVQDKLPKW